MLLVYGWRFFLFEAGGYVLASDIIDLSGVVSPRQMLRVPFPLFLPSRIILLLCNSEYILDGTKCSDMFSTLMLFVVVSFKLFLRITTMKEPTLLFVR